MSTGSSQQVERPAVACVLLAAGNSSRMGATKQLLDFGGLPLVRRAAGTALTAGCRPVAVVMGAHSGLVRNVLSGLPLTLVENREWQRGIGSSLREGVEAVDQPGIDAVIVMLADQPFVGPQMLEALIHTLQETGKPIVASRYGSTVGVPALFSRELFPLLRSVPPEQGCKPVILAYRNRATYVDNPEAATDLDTPTDYQQALQRLSAGPPLPDAHGDLQ